MGNNDLISNIILNEYDGTSLDRRNRAVDVMQSDVSGDRKQTRNSFYDCPVCKMGHSHKSSQFGVCWLLA